MYFEKAGSISGEAHFNEEVKSCFESAFALENDPEKLAELHYTYAFINDAKLKQFDIARQEYQLLITDFSTSFWAEQAKMALEVLGKTDEEILAAFKAKNLQ
jgi:DNA topoisomerase VI subunit A